MSSSRTQADFIPMGGRDFAIVVPYSVLRNPENWDRDPSNAHKWRQVRCHFYCRYLNEGNEPVNGEVLQVFDSPKGVGIRRTESFTGTTQRTYETIYELMRQQSQSVATQLSAALGPVALPAVAIGAQVRTAVTSTLKSSTSDRNLSVTTTQATVSCRIDYKGALALCMQSLATIGAATG